MGVGKKGIFDLVQVLVKMNPEGARMKNTFGDLPIHFLGPGTDDGNKARKFLLKEYPKGLKVQNKDGQLPIHVAGNTGFGETVKLLLKEYPEGFKVEDNKGGNLPIHHACYKGHLTIRLLVDAYPGGLQHKNTNGDLPIHIGLRGTLADIGEYDFIIESYRDCLKVENHDKQLPLHLAASAGSIEVAKLMCKKYPIATHKLDQYGKSPIDVAVQRKPSHARNVITDLSRCFRHAGHLS
jgi:ankyrin repeat protein